MASEAPDSYFSKITDPHSAITAIESGLRFPEVVPILLEKYEVAIQRFAQLVEVSSDSGDLLGRIRLASIPADERMALLKIFRRCVSGTCDTEATKKIKIISTKSLVDNYGSTFKPIERLKEQFAKLNDAFVAALAVSVGEYDNRGKQGYVLEAQFADWFEAKFKDHLTVEGPRGPGPDIELRTVLPEFTGSCPCDFVFRDRFDRGIIAVGFCRYDSTRGGAQSNDRTDGNMAKVYKVREHFASLQKSLRVVFVADGPGLAHKDTWNKTKQLDGEWGGNVRVTTLKLADERITLEWLRGVPPKRRPRRQG